MKKIFFILGLSLFLSGCFQVIALVGPAATGVTSGNIYQSAVSYSVSYGIKKSTGKSIVENVIDLNKKNAKKSKKLVKNKNQDILKSSFSEKNESLVNSFYPSTFKSIMLAY